MDLSRILQELRRELDYLDAAISSLERLHKKAQRGRPPKILSELIRPGATVRRVVQHRRAATGRRRP